MMLYHLKKLSNILYENQGDLNFKNNAKQWGLDNLSFSNGVAEGDLDNDGDVDLVVNNIDQEAFIYQNNAIELAENNYLNIQLKNHNEAFPKITLHTPNGSQFTEVKRVRGYRSAQAVTASFGIGKEEIVDSKLVLGYLMEKVLHY